MINAAFTRNTWKKHSSALNCFKNYERYAGKNFEWPLDTLTVNNFCNWALSSKKLKPSTVEAYIDSLSLLHKMKNLDDGAMNNFVSKLMIRGAENLLLYETKYKRQRNVMSLPLLKILGNEIANTNWKTDSKQIFWASSLLAFFGSCRMGEILSQNEKTFDPAATLLWKDLKYNGESWLVHIKSPKSRIQGGEFIDIFPFTGQNCCPVAALLAWQKISPHAAYPERPVFMFANGNLLTKKKFNEIIRELLHRRMGNASNFISGHSFRAGIPASLAKFPELASDLHIMGWGRWCSKAYLCYTRLKFDQKRKMFEKIVCVLNSNI